MNLLSRISAAFSAFRNQVPQGKAVPLPYFYGTGIQVENRPTHNSRININQLRAYSETPIVRRAIDYIRNQTVRLDWDIIPLADKQLKRDEKKKVEIVKSILKKPNADDNFSSWLSQLIEDMLVIGMGTSEIREWTNNSEHPYLLYPVDAASIQIYIHWDGSPNQPRYAQADLRGNYRNFKSHEMMVMRYTPRTNTPFGLSPTEVAIQQIQYFLDAQSYSGKTASSAVPKKLLYLGTDADREKVREFEIYFRNEIEGRSHIPMIGGVTDPKSIDLGHAGDQALFLQWQNFLIGIIANAFGLDIMKFNSIVGINRSTGDTLDDASDESAIRPMASTIEHYINQNILSLFELDDLVEFKFRFTTSYQDRKSLAVVHQIYAQADVLTINEMRKEAGFPPLPVDEKTGKSKGDYTVSEYRALYGTAPPTEITDQPSDPNNQDENNVVHGTPVPKEKPINQRTDQIEVTL